MDIRDTRFLHRPKIQSVRPLTCAFVSRTAYHLSSVIRQSLVSIPWWLVLSTGAAGCLQQNDLSADALTSFEEATPAAGAQAEGGGKEHREMPPGGTANAAISGTAVSAAASGTTTDASPSPSGSPAPGGAVHSDVLHEDKSPGFGSSTTAEGTPKVVPHDEKAHEAKAHEDKPAGFGSTLPTESTPAAVKHEEHAHKEMPAGFGSSLPPEGKPEAVAVTEHKHQTMPPGYGSKLPPDTGGKAAAVAGGSASGSPDNPAPVAGVPKKVVAAIPTPFETQYKGKKMVTISGKILYSGEVPQNIDLDCFQPDKNAPGGRKMVNKVKLVEAGAYSMKVPAGYGPLIITGFVDLTSNGPDSKDPQGVYAKNPVEIKDKDIKGIDIELKARGTTP